MTHPKTIWRRLSRCRSAIAIAVKRSIRDHRILPRPDGGGPTTKPAAEVRPVVVMVIVTGDWVVPSSVTDCDEIEQVVPRGAPSHASEIAPLNPPLGVTASAYEAVLPAETSADEDNADNEKPLGPQPRTTPLCLMSRLAKDALIPFPLAATNCCVYSPSVASATCVAPCW